MADSDERGTRLVLVRHGQAHCNADAFVGGHTACTGLTDLGVTQVEALRDRWKNSGEVGEVAAVYSSTLPRARQTAEILAPAIGGYEPVQECDLCEFHTGEEADGIPWAEFDERYTLDFVADPFNTPLEGPGWESIEEFRFRVGRTLFRLAREHENQTIVLAVHGGVIDASLSVFFGLPFLRDTRAVDLYTYNASVTEWHRPPAGKERSKWRLARYNDAAHCPELT